MPTWLRNILAVFAGVMTAGILVGVVETLGHLFWPPPEGIDPNDPASIAAIMEQVPLPAKINVLLAWFVGAFVGSALSARLAGSRPVVLAYVVGTIQLTGGVTTLFMIPHPPWMVAGALLVPILASYLGGRLGSRRNA